jgi:hypothetical protein
VGERGLEREQQQWRATEEEEAGAPAGQGELLVVGVLLRVVREWEGPEDAELQRGDGFSLVIYAWKS